MVVVVAVVVVAAAAVVVVVGAGCGTEDLFPPPTPEEADGAR